MSNTFPDAGTWTLNTLHSTVAFAVTHHGVMAFRGRFTAFTAELDAGAATVTGTARTDSIEVPPILMARVRDAEFLDAERHPEIAFASTAIRVSGANVTVDGDLTMKGVTRPVTAHGTFAGPSRTVGRSGDSAERHLGLELEITIDRRDYGIAFNNVLLDGRLNLGWDVRLSFSLDFVGAD